jgi:murein DD-endopeptidase MepM/ murein hydrolase activator NlpD
MISWPVDSRRITSKFGKRAAPVIGASTEHNGIDIGIPVGTDVRSVADGKVVAVWDDTTYGGGYSIRIEHDGGLGSGYCHLSEQLVKKGDLVKAGQVIARSGGLKGAPGAGKSSGPHLHLTIRQFGVAIDPLTVLGK